MTSQVLELAQAIKENGRRSTQKLPELLEQANHLAHDESLDPISRALAHRAAGNARHLLSQFQPALASYDAAVSILESTDNTEELGRTLHAKVGLLMFMGRFDELLACADRARQLFETLGDRHRLARLDVNLSQAYTRMDRFDLVLECTERAIPILKEIGDKEGYLAALLNSAIAMTWRHEFELAEQRYREALGLASDLGMTALVLLCRYNIAYFEYLDGNAEKALAELDYLRSEYRNIGDDRHICLCWLDEADILLEIGDLEGAIAAARRARALGVSLNLEAEVGKSLLFEAVASLRLGDADPAEMLLKDAALRFQSEHNSIWAAVTKLQTALFHGEQGEVGTLLEALEARDTLADSGMPHRQALADIVIGRIQRAHGESRRAVQSFRSALDSAQKGRSEWMQFHAAYELAVTLSERSNSESLLLFKNAEAMLDSLWSRLGSDDLKLAFLNDRENVYTHLIRHALDESPEAAFELSEKSRSRVLYERLVAEGRGGRAVRSRLNDNEVVLEYFVNGNDLLIFTATSSELKCVKRAGVISRISDHCQSLERHLSSCSLKWERLQAVHGQLLQTAQAHLEALYRDLIAPVAPGLRARIVVVPHGFLHSVPFHALSDGHEHLMDRHEVAYSPSASLYSSSPALDGLEAPLFIAFAPGGRTSSVSEVELAAATQPGANVLVNPRMSELSEALSVPRSLVHIAGHAGIDSVGGRISWIETTEGRLTGRDLTSMSIRARTVVITGCQTARRRISPGDEWQGLMRAFYLSGASTIVSAFWDIRDESAHRFASEFYKHFTGANAPAAVASASATIRNWHQHPYFWAGFGAFVRMQS